MSWKRIIVPAALVICLAVAVVHRIYGGEPPTGAVGPNQTYGNLDLKDEWWCVRDASTNDTSVSNTAATYTSLLPASGTIQVNKVFPAGGAANVKLSFVGADSSDGTADNGTFTVTIVGWTPGRSQTGAVTAADGTILYIGAVTLGSDVATNGDPIGYDSNTGPWYWADTVNETKDAGGNSLSSSGCYDCSGDNRRSTVMFDPRGERYIFVYLTGRSGITRIRAYIHRCGGS